jgi:hypothetical protein
MVGVLLDPESEVVPPIRKALADTALGIALRLCKSTSGAPFTRPSILFSDADFDTEHERDPALAPPYGTIRVSHFFFAFGYPTTTLKPKKREREVVAIRARLARLGKANTLDSFVFFG